MICTFFWHSDAPDSIEPLVQKVVFDLIVEKRVTKFYVGSQGNFDRIARQVLKKAKQRFPFIECLVVLAYMPINRSSYDDSVFETVYPEGLENVPLRMAIAKRNEWMVSWSDVVVTFVNRNFGGAAKYKLLEKKS